jgi:hypothetical protein
MIVVRLTGGLGNQMFQYAAGKKLAKVHSTELKLDISWYQGKERRQQKRSFKLGVFNIIADIATQDDLNLFFKNNFFKDLKRKARKTLGLKPETLIATEKNWQFHDFPHHPQHLYLKGYWQNESLFKDIRKELVEDFSLKLENGADYQALKQKISSCTSTSIHVRRGDFAHESDINRIHGTCSLDYYRECIKNLQERVGESHYFLFSDDPEWVKENLVLDGEVEILSDFFLNDYEELKLMSLCQHNIIANSTFSWWAAWLNQNPEKLIFAPKKWYSAEARNHQSPALKSWIVI